MTKVIKITESQYNRLLVGNVAKVLTPMEKLMECKISNDHKYVVYEGMGYNRITGEEVPLMEDWSLSDVLHTGADLLSMGIDFVAPGAGAAVDVVHSLTYLAEAQGKPDDEKNSLYMMGAITLAFVVAPGPLQAFAPILKKIVKTGGKAIAKFPMALKALNAIRGVLGKIITTLPDLISTAVNSSFGKKILGKYGPLIDTAVKDFSRRVKPMFEELVASKDSGLFKASSTQGKMIKNTAKSYQKGGKYAKGATRNKIANISYELGFKKLQAIEGITKILKNKTLKTRLSKMSKYHAGLAGLTPITAVPKMARYVAGLFSKKYRGKMIKDAAGNLVPDTNYLTQVYRTIGFWVYSQSAAHVIQSIFCKYGIRSKEEYEEWMPKLEAGGTELTGSVGEADIALWKKVGVTVFNLPGSYLESLFHPNCKSATFEHIVEPLQAIVDSSPEYFEGGMIDSIKEIISSSAEPFKDAVGNRSVGGIKRVNTKIDSDGDGIPDYIDRD